MERSGRERPFADWNGDVALADVEGSTRLWETQPEEMTAAVARLDRTLVRLRRRPSRGAPGRAGRGRQLRGRVRPRQSDAVACALDCSGHRWRRSGCASACTPARSTCATKATTSGRRSTGPHGCAIWRTAARPCCPARPSDLVVDRLPAGCVADRSWHPPAARPAPARTGHAAVPSRPAQRVPAAADTESRCRTAPSGAADEFCWARRRDRRRAADLLGRQPAGHPDRRRRCRARPGWP